MADRTRGAAVSAQSEEIEQLKRHIAALEQYIAGLNTCIACECCLVPSDAPPRCFDCSPSDDAEAGWEERYLSDPVAHFRKKFAGGSPPDAAR